MRHQRDSVLGFSFVLPQIRQPPPAADSGLGGGKLGVCWRKIYQPKHCGFRAASERGLPSKCCRASRSPRRRSPKPGQASLSAAPATSPQAACRPWTGISRRPPSSRNWSRRSAGVLHPEARDELRSVALWYNEQRPGLGAEFGSSGRGPGTDREQSEFVPAWPGVKSACDEFRCDFFS